jgi:hypothetical protein
MRNSGRSRDYPDDLEFLRVAADLLYGGGKNKMKQKRKKLFGQKMGRRPLIWTAPLLEEERRSVCSFRRSL